MPLTVPLPYPNRSSMALAFLVHASLPPDLAAEETEVEQCAGAELDWPDVIRVQLWDECRHKLDYPRYGGRGGGE